MDLWIRSQDKECLMKVDRLDYDLSSGSFKIMANGYETLLAMYPTKERALEVLDEIQKYFEKMGTNEMLTNEVGIINGMKHYGIVYEMPKE